jgi:hypothetical protein
MKVNLLPFLFCLLSVPSRWVSQLAASGRAHQSARIAHHRRPNYPQIRRLKYKTGPGPNRVGCMYSIPNPLDCAAWAGITASNPFPPLPSEFRGQYLARRFRFCYNPTKEEIAPAKPTASAPTVK